MRVLIMMACCLATGTLWSGASAADTPQISCNITTEFAMNLAECVFKPFEDLIARIPFSHHHTKTPARPHAKYMGGINDQQPPIIRELKKSKTVADVFRVIHGLEQNEFEKLLIKLTPPDQRANDDAATRRTLIEHVLQEIVKSVDFDQVFDESLLRLLGTSGALRAKLLEVVADKQIDLPLEWDDIVALLCAPIMGDPHLCKMAKCLPTYNEASLEDDLAFVQCFFICQDLPIISACMREAFAGCEVGVLYKVLNIKLDWMGDLIMRVFVDFLQMDHCLLTSNQDGKKYDIAEGRSNMMLTLHSMVPPGVHCFSKVDFMNTALGAAELLVQFITGGMGACNVEIQLSTSNYVRDLMTQRTPEKLGLIRLGPVAALQYPICRSGRGIPQYVIGWHDYANESSGVIKLTNENWNETFSIPVDATIDNKVAILPGSKFYQKDFLTLKVRAGMLTKFSSKIELNRVDKDVYKFRTCWIVNGPHLRTFDGHYFNNFYEGHFVLYRHKNLHYEVQVVTQACSNNGVNTTCTCAASVRSVNDVFSVDWCRRSNQSQDDVIMKVALYLIGDLTNGTRIYRHDQGITYKVLLPHGTLVTIMATEGRLNVWVRPSAYDAVQGILFPSRQVEGLCGDFNGSTKKDLRKRDGKSYTGSGSKSPGGQPQVFNKDWRITDENDIILWGLNGTGKSEGSVIEQYCACSHILMMGSQCNCGYDMLVSDCDINTDGKLPQLFPLISKYSRPMFYTDRPDQEKEDLIDFSDGYMTIDPEIRSWVDDNDTTSFCKELIEEDAVQLECQKLIEKMNFTDSWMPELEIYQTVCQRDAQLSGEDDWSLSSKMAARQHCHDMLDLTSLFSDKALQPLYNIDCPNDCNPGINNVSYCINGTCVCDEHHKGPDCSLLEEEEPVMVMPKFSQCDTRYQNCSYATVYGKNFVKDKVYCHHAQSGQTIHPDILSTNQLACKLPSDGGSISVRNEGPLPSTKVELQTSANLHISEVVTPIDTGSFEFVAFDSLCFVMDEHGKTQERQETDHCLVKSTCYKPEQASADDECYVCDPDVSIANLQYSKSEPCVQRKQDEEDKAAAHRKEWNTRIIVSCLLCGIVIIITVVAFIFSRSMRNKQAKKAPGKGIENGDLSAHSPGYEMTGSSTPDDGRIYIEIVDGGGIDNPAADLTAGTDQPADTLTSTSPPMLPANGGIPGSPSNSSQQPAGNEINAREMAEFWHIKHMAAERSRTRADSQGSRASRSSLASKGIGGSGMSHFSARLRSSTGGSFGMGAAGPAHLGRFARRAYSGATDEDEVVEKIGMGGGGTVDGVCVRL